MKLIRIPSKETISVEEASMPEVEAGSVLLAIKYVGFCGSDLNTFLGRNLMAKDAVIPGHEIGAVIEEVGNNVPDFLKPGMTVTVNPYTNCGHCAACRSGHVNACEHNETLGVQRDGAMREYILLPWEKVIPAKGLTPLQCALVEPMSVGFHAISRAEVTDIDTVMVLGCGMIGVGAIVRASLRGATVIAVDLDDEKLSLAKTLGAKYVINSKTENLYERLQEITAGFGPSVVVEAVGSVPTYQAAIEEVGFTGRVVCIGYSKNDVSFHTKLFVQKELNIRGSRNAMPSDFEAVINYLIKGQCPTEKLISCIVKPESAIEAMQNWCADPGKVFRILVDFN